MEEDQAPETAVLPETESEPLDLAVVQAWINRIKPSAIVALLKDPEYAFAVSRVFLGFRPDTKGYSNPLVRTRLAQAAAKDPKLAEKLEELAQSEPVTVPPAAKSPTEKAPSIEPTRPDLTAALRAERDVSRKERNAARQALTQSQSERDAARKDLHSVEAERDEAVRAAKKQIERVSRLERQVARLQQAETRLLKVLNEDKVSFLPSARARSAGMPKPSREQEASPWLIAVRHLLDKSKFELALALAEDVLKSSAEESDALQIASMASEGKKDARSAIFYAQRLLSVQIVHTELSQASETLLRLLRLRQSPEESEADTRQFLAAISPSDTRVIESVQLMLSRLRGTHPAAHHWLTEWIATDTLLGPVLMPPPGALNADDTLPIKLALGQTVTARQAIEAVDRGTPLVDAVRKALTALSGDTETSTRVWSALEQAASEDLTRLVPLRREPRGPIVIDGSNVAWFDQESLVHGKPRLKHLRAMRRALWARGFFPVVLYADANLPYFIDEAPALRAMRDRREVILVDAGTVADEVLLRMAKHLSAPLVTNDKMEDWDPDGEVPKVRYTISLGGEAHLLTDI